MAGKTFNPNVPIDSIIRLPQVRKQFDEDALTDLGSTVREHGVQVPVLLQKRDGQLYLVDGERRIRAAIAAEQKTVPAIIESELSDIDAVVRQILVNWQREDVAPIDLAQRIDHLMKQTNWSAAQVAEKFGKSRAAITRLLAVLELPPAIQELVQAGKVPVSSAYDISLTENPEQQIELANQVVQGMTRDALSAARRAACRPTPEVNGATPARVTAKLSGNRSVTVCAAGLTLESFISTLKELLEHGRDAQRKGLALGTFQKILLDTAKISK